VDEDLLGAIPALPAKGNDASSSNHDFKVNREASIDLINTAMLREPFTAF
jgi:hypothetical protein